MSETGLHECRCGRPCMGSTSAAEKSLLRVAQQFESDNHRLEKDLDKWRSLAVGFTAYAEHGRECILSFWEAGRPRNDGGYETKYKGKWYQTKPVDETPKCDCGLSEIWADFEAAKGKTDD